MQQILGKEFFDAFEKRKFYSLMNTFLILKKKCCVANKILRKKNQFLCVYGQRDKFRFIIKKGVQGKHSVIRDLSSCVIKSL